MTVSSVPAPGVPAFMPDRGTDVPRKDLGAALPATGVRVGAGTPAGGISPSADDAPYAPPLARAGLRADVAQPHVRPEGMGA